MTTLAGQISATGFSYPSYADTLAQLQNLYYGIYGADVVLTPDTQDGQFLAILAQAVFDANQMAAAVFAAFSPTYAQGTGLSSLVKINGLQRDVATNSEVAVTVGGVAGTTIVNGLVGDDQNLGTVWALPASVTIPPGGSITVTATCTEPGSTQAADGTITVILNPQLGWQTVTNAAEASSGNPVEGDAALRTRQSVSTSLPATTPLAAIRANVANVPGVADLVAYQNDTGSTDGNGAPNHSVYVVVNGGSVEAVATAIFEKKAPGVPTYGTTSFTVFDQNGVPDTINFFEVAFEDLYVVVTLTPLTGYTAAIGLQIVAAVVAFINGLPIGADVYHSQLIAAACLFGTPQQATFDVTSVTIGTAPSPVGTGNIAIAFNYQASILAANVTVVT